MSNVERLPVQHPRAPHCPQCKRDLPNFSTIGLSMSPQELRHIRVLSAKLVLHVRCECGHEMVLSVS